MKTLDPDLLNEIVQRLVNTVKPERIYLFGSHAYGQPNDDSDIDLFIIVGDSDLPIREKVIEGYRTLKGLRVPKDIKVVTQTEFARRSQWLNSIERVVAEKGKLLYGSNL